ncbi:MAG: hypothetical protein PWR30_336 [Candidatus Woesearchaeota archaeon]|nr:hypothetical protein [Candidatus Woesearchaeota archaeon]
MAKSNTNKKKSINASSKKTNAGKKSSKSTSSKEIKGKTSTTKKATQKKTAQMKTALKKETKQTSSKSESGKNNKLNYNFFGKIKNIFVNPREFFSGLNEQGIGKAFLYSLVFILIYQAIISLIFTEGAQVRAYAVLGEARVSIFYGWQMFSRLFIGSVIWRILLLFIFSLLLHIWIMIFKGSGSYEKTFQLVVYSRTPVWLLGWIPIVRILAWAYNVILLIIGTEKLHKIENKTATWMYLGPIIIFVLLTALSWLFIFTNVFRLMSLF